LARVDEAGDDRDEGGQLVPLIVNVDVDVVC
jgi:hypothetical protein